MSSSVDIVIHNELSEIALVRDALDQLGSELEVPAQAIVQLQVALDEIVSNVIKYSWVDGGKHDILVRITVDDDGVALDIFDDGEPFDPRGAPEPLPSLAGKRPEPGGVGIHMVRKLVDDFAYERSDAQNHTRLTKKCATGALTKEN
jgi:serine/threonine-protein kinase RsbW